MSKQLHNSRAQSLSRPSFKDGFRPSREGEPKPNHKLINFLRNLQKKRKIAKRLNSRHWISASTETNSKGNSNNCAKLWSMHNNRHKRSRKVPLLSKPNWSHASRSCEQPRRQWSTKSAN